MTLQHVSIVYAGSLERGHALQRALGPHGAHLWPATQAQEALAFYVFYLPDHVIIDDVPDAKRADEVYFHLSSIEAAPMIILSSEPRLGLWREVASASTLVLAHDLPDAELLEAVARLSLQHRSAFKTQKARAKLEDSVASTSCG
ncbi:MAG: hypothetical protein M3511_14930 [Deinococcota bacterium]|nr:hypothetical protein [Deinococcota bacterium]